MTWTVFSVAVIKLLMHTNKLSEGRLLSSNTQRDTLQCLGHHRDRASMAEANTEAMSENNGGQAHAVTESRSYVISFKTDATSPSVTTDQLQSQSAHECGSKCVLKAHTLLTCSLCAFH